MAKQLQHKFLLSGGGTGGHIYPAVSIANTLKENYPNADFLFVGASDRMEMEKVPKAGYPIKGLWISGIQRKLTFKNLMFPFKLMSSITKAYFIIKKFKPSAVIGTGGFASGPTLWVASKLGIPTILQEQNSYPGITNKMLAGKAHKIFVAYDNLERFFPANKIIKSGNPVRQDILDITDKKDEALKYFHVSTDKKTVLVLGGSLGAKAINLFLQENLNWFKEHNVQLIWQTGKLYYQESKRIADELGCDDIKVQEFISRMDLAYAAADIILSRAGAGTISELCIVGKPVILIPSPNVAEDHQTKNARALADKKAAFLVNEKEMKVYLFEHLELLLKDEEQSEKLSKNISRMALPKATETIVKEIKKLIS